MLTVVKTIVWGPFVIQWLSDTAHLKLSLGARINIRYRNLSSSSRNFTPKRPLSLQTVVPYESWTVREHQNQKYSYGHRALILLILLGSSYR